MSVEARDQAFQAMQRGETQVAIEQLERVCQEDPQDYQAHMYLGAAYGQAGRYADAMPILTRAVELQPGNAQARYNLGIAMERAGFPGHAITVFQQALTLQPNYPRAQEALQRLQQGGPSAPPAATTPNAGYGAPTPTVFGQPAYSPSPTINQPPTYNPAQQPTAGFTPPASVPPGYTPESQVPGAGLNQPPAYGPPGYTPGQPAPGSGYTQPTAYNHPPAYVPPADAGLAGYGSAGSSPIPLGPPPYVPPGGGYGAPPPGAYPSTGRPAGNYNPYVEDSFNPLQAVKDWFQVLISPQQFFREQAGREGMKAPLAFLFIFMVLMCAIAIAGAVAAVLRGQGGGAGSIVFAVLILIAGYLTVGYLVAILGTLIWAGIVHLVGKLFGNSASYSGSFRACVYAAAPSGIGAVIGAVIALVGMAGTPRIGLLPSPPPQIRVAPAQYQPGQFPNQPPFSSGSPSAPFGSGSGHNPYQAGRNPFVMASNPIMLALNLVFLVWELVLLGIGICHMQQISTGGAIGTIILSIIVGLILLFVVIFVIGLVFAGIFAATMSGLQH